MGLFNSILHDVFGGSGSQSSSQSQSSSSNLAYPMLSSTLGGAVGQAPSAMSQIATLLGLGGNSAAASAGLDNYANSAGYNFAQKQGMDAINNNMYARGLGKSGADEKALAQFTTGLNQQYLQNYLGDLSNLGGLGINAGDVLARAGNVSNSSSTSKGSSDSETGGLGKFIGSILASDRRLKRDIKRVGTYPDGLGAYEWHYAFDPTKTRYRGVMADEVRLLRPEAYVPNFRGEYAGVNYAALGLQMEVA